MDLDRFWMANLRYSTTGAQHSASMDLFPLLENATLLPYSVYTLRPGCLWIRGWWGDEGRTLEPRAGHSQALCPWC